VAHVDPNIDPDDLLIALRSRGIKAELVQCCPPKGAAYWRVRDAETRRWYVIESRSGLVWLVAALALLALGCGGQQFQADYFADAGEVGAALEAAAGDVGLVAEDARSADEVLVDAAGDAGDVQSATDSADEDLDGGQLDAGDVVDGCHTVTGYWCFTPGDFVPCGVAPGNFTCEAGACTAGGGCALGSRCQDNFGAGVVVGCAP
jgi:hypothetical protein